VEIELKDREGLRQTVQVMVDEREIGDAYNQAIDNIRTKAKIPGFRVGKAPDVLIYKNYRESIDDSVLSLIEKRVLENLKGKDLSILNVISAEVDHLENGHSCTIFMRLDLYPEFEIPDWKNIVLPNPDVTVSEKEVDEIIEYYRLKGNSDGKLGGSEELSKTFGTTDMDAVRDYFREQLQCRKSAIAKNAQRDAVLQFFSNSMNIPLPQSLLQEQFSTMLDRLKNEAVEMSPEDMEKHAMENARINTLCLLITDAIAKRDHLQLNLMDISKVVSPQHCDSPESLKRYLKNLESNHKEFQDACRKAFAIKVIDAIITQLSEANKSPEEVAHEDSATELADKKERETITDAFLANGNTIEKMGDK
jgi:FKBP-type peptidyl-prolyl cis-trans isomerase (trigger factor)